VDELTCKELVELVTAYLDGLLPSEERARFDEHLRDCPGCVAYLDQMRRTRQLTGMLREEQLTAEARDALLRAFHGWTRCDKQPAAP
jgi:anti-sigma factor RsiW